MSRDIRPSELQPCSRFYGELGFEPVPVPAGIEGRAVWLEYAIASSRAASTGARHARTSAIQPATWSS